MEKVIATKDSHHTYHIKYMYQSTSISN